MSRHEWIVEYRQNKTARYVTNLHNMHYFIQAKYCNIYNIAIFSFKLTFRALTLCNIIFELYTQGQG